MIQSKAILQDYLLLLSGSMEERDSEIVSGGESGKEYRRFVIQMKAIAQDCLRVDEGGETREWRRAAHRRRTCEEGGARKTAQPAPKSTLRGGAYNLLYLPSFVSQIARFRRAPVQIKDLRKMICSSSEG